LYNIFKYAIFADCFVNLQKKDAGIYESK
jgi:hypothetical protein